MGLEFNILHSWQHCVLHVGAVCCCCIRGTYASRDAGLWKVLAGSREQTLALQAPFSASGLRPDPVWRVSIIQQAWLPSIHTEQAVGGCGVCSSGTQQTGGPSSEPGREAEKRKVASVTPVFAAVDGPGSAGTKDFGCFTWSRTTLQSTHPSRGFANRSTLPWLSPAFGGGVPFEAQSTQHGVSHTWHFPGPVSTHAQHTAAVSSGLAFLLDRGLLLRHNEQTTRRRRPRHGIWGLLFAALLVRLLLLLLLLLCCSFQLVSCFTQPTRRHQRASHHHKHTQVWGLACKPTPALAVCVASGQNVSTWPFAWFHNHRQRKSSSSRVVCVCVDTHTQARTQKDPAVLAIAQKGRRRVWLALGFLCQFAQGVDHHGSLASSGMACFGDTRGGQPQARLGWGHHHTTTGICHKR